MNRALTANVGWLLITVGVVTILAVGGNLFSLTTIFVGFFLRLIYNSEKYKYFKFLNSELLSTFGKSLFQQKALSNSLFGLCRAILDFCAVIILPFIIIPRLCLPWYFDCLFAFVYIIALKPIFANIDEIDKEHIRQVVSNYGREKRTART